jgi:hypothetical protein
MSRPRITPYEHVQVVSVPQFVYPSVPADFTCLSQPLSTGFPPVNVDPAKPRAQPVRIQPDPYRDEQGPDFLRRVYYSDGSARLLHTEHGETHEVAAVAPGNLSALADSALLYYRGVALPYLLEGVSKEELAWLRGQPVDTTESHPSSLPDPNRSELDPYRRPSPTDPTPDILKRYYWEDGTTSLYLTDHYMHDVNEVVGVAPVNPNACPGRSFFVDLYLRGISAPYRLQVSIDEYKWLKESVGIRT